MTDNGYQTIVRLAESEGDEDSPDGQISLVIINQEPPVDYLETTRLIRNRSNVPIIILNQKSDTVDMIVALEMGADDYMTLPYERLALMARIRALLRRTQIDGDGNPPNRSVSPHDLIVIGPLKIDCNFRDAFVQEAPVGLTNLEFKLLYHFVTHQEELFSKEEIFTEIWGYDIATNSHSLATYIHSLKKKLRSLGVWLPLTNYPGLGYKLGPTTIITLFPAAETGTA